MMQNDQRAAFREEAYELLGELETSLLELEEQPENMDLIGRVFRAMHTIKGSGSMFGFTEVSRFTHEVETVYDMVRNGALSVSPQLVSLSLAARDMIKELLDADLDDGNVDQQRVQELIDGFRAYLKSDSSPAKDEVVASSSANLPKNETLPRVYRIHFQPAADIFLTGTNPLGLLNELRELGDCHVIARTEQLPCLDELEPEKCYVGWDIILTTERSVDEIRDVFIFVEDDSKLSITLIEDGSVEAEEGGGSYKMLGELLVERGDLDKETLQRFLDGRKKIGELLMDAGLVKPGRIEAALKEQEQVRKVREKRQPATPASNENQSSLRVPADKLDKLVDLVGELVTVQSRLSQTAAVRQDAELTAIAEEVERLTEELRDNTLNIRMLPIGSTFSKFKRLVRDLSQDLGKQVEMTTSGAETELDKTVLEKLNDPLVHIIRNSIDHGIETPDVRRAAGKPEGGTVHLSAEHSGDSVLLTIRDDGKGLDANAIRAKAVEKGLISETDTLSTSELYQLIFAPGFSTAKTISSVSGRGVGMDVVKKAIETLRGSIEIDSAPGLGTLLKIKIPLTLAIIESLLVRIGDAHFVLPLALVEECVELTAADVAAAHGRHLANVRGQLIPYIPLRQRFAIDGDVPAIQQVVVTQVDQQQIGFVVDHVIGEHQTVIKSLGRMYKDVSGISGATILGDGSVALILDAYELLHSSAAEEARQCAIKVA